MGLNESFYRFLDV